MPTSDWFQELQKVVAPNVLSKLLQRWQAEEVKAANLGDNLVSCPFCPYVTIMDNPDDKVLVCRNPDCGRDSCRLCQVTIDIDQLQLSIITPCGVLTNHRQVFNILL